MATIIFDRYAKLIYERVTKGMISLEAYDYYVCGHVQDCFTTGSRMKASIVL